MKDLITLEDFLLVKKCSKAAYLNSKQPELADKNLSHFLKEAGEAQTTLEKIIQPNGIRISKFSSIEERDRKSREAIKKRNTIHMATFISDDSEKVEVNTLQRDIRTTAWILKTEPGDISGADIWTAGYQNYVLQKCGIKVDTFLIALLNPEYIHNSDNGQPLFIFKNVTNKCKKRFREVERYIARLRKTLKYKKAPGVVLGYQCPEPKCIFHKHCWSDFTENSVFDFLDMSFPQKFRLYQRGYENMTSVPSNTRLTSAEKMQLDSHKNNKVYINKTEIKKLYHSVANHLRVIYLDLNSMRTLLPKYSGSKPFAYIPFHYSVIKTVNGVSFSEKFSANPNGLYDIRLEFAKKLIKSLEPESDCPIVVWKALYTKYYLKDCQRLFPSLAKDFQKIEERLISVCKPFEERHFYHPKFSGRDDYWAVARVLASEEFVQKMEINNNWDAQVAFEKMKGASVNEYRNLSFNLETYSVFKVHCLIKIIQKLKAYL